jgi:hypothetical protein
LLPFIPDAAPLRPAAPGPLLRAQVSELLQHDRPLAVSLAHEIFRQCRTSDLAAEVSRVFRDAPALADGIEDDPSDMRPPAPRQIQPDNFVDNRSPGVAVSAQVNDRCQCCDEVFGDGTSQCTALATLDSLHDHLEERDRIVDEELECGFDPAATFRSARWYMYRTYVATKWGHLGRHNRVRIPDCVLAAIRARYPAPGCDCVTMHALATCTRHGYVGFREAEA